mmetsp:Transcript_9180/g.10647  ORF Transcript_9180/g.10647 Transcript_9180/m.10647 type:complete len:248 (-) Transcript_9180:39-782(-)
MKIASVSIFLHHQVNVVVQMKLLFLSFLILRINSFHIISHHNHHHCSRRAFTHRQDNRNTIINISNNNQYSHSFSPSSTKLKGNIYDEWKSDMAIVDTLPLDEEFVLECIDEIVYSDFGSQMFGVHDQTASLGITGEVSLYEISGPEVILSLSGKFWHTRSYVLGRIAMYLNARMPEITRVSIDNPDELQDFEYVHDVDTNEVIEVIDRRSPDYNGDRETMIYQGIDPDMRGPFPGGLNGEFKLIPS